MLYAARETEAFMGLLSTRYSAHSAVTEMSQNVPNTRLMIVLPVKDSIACKGNL